MTINELIAELNARVNENGETQHFAGDFAGRYDISATEAARIAEAVSSADEFENVWENTDWWTDDNN